MKSLNLLLLLMLFITNYLYASNNQEQSIPTKGQLIPAPSYQSLLSTKSILMDTTDIYAEDFESGGTNWSVTGSWQVGDPESGPNSGYNSVNCAGTNLAGSYGNNTDDWLISLEINLPALNDSKEKLQLLFQEWYSIESSYDYGRVKISTDAGTTWNELENRSGSSDWRKTIIDISSYNGQSIKIALFSYTITKYLKWFEDKNIAGHVLLNKDIKKRRLK